MTGLTRSFDRERFNADGVTFVAGAFGAEWVELARRGIDRNIGCPSPLFRRLSADGHGFLSDMWSRRFVPEFERFCLHSPAAGLAARALHSDRIRLVQDVWFVKQPGTSERTPWHHDAVISGPFCSVWVALDPTPRAATVEFVRGSHKWGKALMPKSFFDSAKADHDDAGTGSAAEDFYAEFHGNRDGRSDSREFGVIPDIEADRAAYDIVGWDMEPGDCVVFDARTVHGAPGNHLDSTVRRFVTRWVTDESVIAPHGQETLDALKRAGLEVDLAVGQPIRGAMFPEIRIGTP